MLFPLFDRNPTQRFPWFTLLLIAANSIIMWQMSTLPQSRSLELVYQHGMVPQRLSSAGQPGPLVIKKEFPAPDADINAAPAEFETELTTTTSDVYLTLLSMMFLHGGWLHLVSNMWMLWVFGNNIEDRLGHMVFLAFYLTGGVLSCLVQYAFDPMGDLPVIGASGAVWAVLGAYAVTYPKAKVKTLIFVGFPLLFDLPSLVVIAVWFCIDLALGFINLENIQGAQVAHWAHVGGCVVGVLMIPFLLIGTSPPDADWRAETSEMLEPISPPER